MAEEKDEDGKRIDRIFVGASLTVDFLPSSDKSLSKLFATVSLLFLSILLCKIDSFILFAISRLHLDFVVPCMGGKLKLHKAKEHYLVRLRQEWAEEEAACFCCSRYKSSRPPKKLNLLHNIDNRTPSSFGYSFPALRTVKSLPFSGTGEHKYSFQRVQLPSFSPPSFLRL
ncbi:hypothetical protein M0R45_018095 [Rubus argutus]|uniref:Uncharacterized protein n=1 Tax=Rubus argutus TaxID=59490 RepID=A0AAW1X2W5_RUBAR